MVIRFCVCRFCICISVCWVVNSECCVLSMFSELVMLVW